MKGRSLGAILAAAWFVLYGLLSLTNFRFEMQGVVMGVLAVLAGAALLWGK